MSDGLDLLELAEKSAANDLRHAVNKFAQMAIHLIWTAAPKDAVYFAYLIAIPRHFFNSVKAFSTRCL